MAPFRELLFIGQKLKLKLQKRARSRKAQAHVKFLSTCTTAWNIKQRKGALMRDHNSAWVEMGVGGGEMYKIGQKLKSVFNLKLITMNLMRRIWKSKLLYSLWSSSFQRFPSRSSLTRYSYNPLKHPNLHITQRRVP